MRASISNSSRKLHLLWPGGSSRCRLRLRLRGCEPVAATTTITPWQATQPVMKHMHWGRAAYVPAGPWGRAAAMPAGPTHVPTPVLSSCSMSLLFRRIRLLTRLNRPLGIGNTFQHHLRRALLAREHKTCIWHRCAPMLKCNCCRTPPPEHVRHEGKKHTQQTVNKADAGRTPSIALPNIPEAWQATCGSAH